MKESSISIDGKNVTFEKPLNVYMLKKISDSIDEIKLTKEDKAKAFLSFSELQLIRRLLIEEEVRTQLMYHNVVEGSDYRKSKRS